MRFWKKKKDTNTKYWLSRIKPDDINYGIIRALINEAGNKQAEITLPGGMKIVIKPIEESSKSNYDPLDL